MLLATEKKRPQRREFTPQFARARSPSGQQPMPAGWSRSPRRQRAVPSPMRATDVPGFGPIPTGRTHDEEQRDVKQTRESATILKKKHEILERIAALVAEGK